MAKKPIAERTWLIYRVTCDVSGKSYIGLTSEPIAERWSKHVHKAMVTKSRSPECVKKMADKKRGVPRPPGAGAKTGAALRGRKRPAHVVMMVARSSGSCGRRNPTGMKGVKPHRGKWCARITINGKGIHLGVFDTPELAHAAYLTAAQRRIEEVRSSL